MHEGIKYFFDEYMCACKLGTLPPNCLLHCTPQISSHHVLIIYIQCRIVTKYIPRQQRVVYNLKNVFIKNFGEDFTDEQLQKLFAPFGRITSATVKKNEDGQSKGYGYVSYDSCEAADKVCRLL